MKNSVQAAIEFSKLMLAKADVTHFAKTDLTFLGMYLIVEILFPNISSREGKELFLL